LNGHTTRYGGQADPSAAQKAGEVCRTFFYILSVLEEAAGLSMIHNHKKWKSYVSMIYNPDILCEGDSNQMPLPEQIAAKKCLYPLISFAQ
jgi:hypothetical protein